MNIYQLTILNKDEIHIPAIEKLANTYGANFSHPIETKDGKVFEFEFPAYEHMEKFKASLDGLKLFKL